MGKALTTTIAWLFAVIHLPQVIPFQFLSLRSRIPFVRTPSPTVLLDATSDGGHSYVEESLFDERASEIEAMGGDPFFLTGDEGEDMTEEVEQDMSLPSAFFSNNPPAPARLDEPTEEEGRYATDGKGPTPKKASREKSYLEWDGTVDENAHLGLD